MRAAHKDTNWPEAQLHMLFSQEFILGRKGLGKGKIKSLFYENGKKISWSGSNSNLASGTKEACNSDAVGKGTDLKGQVPYLLSSGSQRRQGPTPTAGWPGSWGHHTLDSPGSAPGHSQASL